MKSREKRCKKDKEEDAKSSKQKEKKQKHHDAIVENGASDITVADDLGLPSKKRRKTNTGRNEDEGLRVNKSKKSSAIPEDGRVDAEDATASNTKENKKKKREKKDRKKTDTSSSLPDPSADAELTDKARGALTYAYTRLSSPGTWKFNKAHQNWVVKHFFSSDAIPEKYIPTVTGYLAGCQGGVWDNLIQSCNKHLETNNESPDSVPAPAPAASALSEGADLPRNSPEVQEAIQARARALLDALGSKSSHS